VDPKYHKYIKDQDVNATQELTHMRQRVVEPLDGKSNYHVEKTRVSPDPKKKEDPTGVKNVFQGMLIFLKCKELKGFCCNVIHISQ